MYEKKKNEYDQQVNRSEELAGQNAEHLAELKLKVQKFTIIHLGYTHNTLQEDEINGLKQEINRINKLREGLQRKLRGVEEQKADVESKRDALKQQLTSVERGNVTYTYFILWYILCRAGASKETSRIRQKIIR